MRTAQRAPAETRAASKSARAPRPLDFARVEEVVRGLQVPWEIVFASRRVMLVTERGGAVRIVDRGRLRERPAARLAVVARGEGGLHGLALHPDFPRRRFAFVYYTAGDGNRVSRFTVSRQLRLAGEKVLIRGIPAGAIHNGGRIAFGPDRRLYVGTGEAGRPALAADLRSLGGKILRVRTDGGIPRDNPFGRSPVYSYGHRNVQGFGWDGAGRMYASEHGPSGELGLCCHDEVNLVEAGRFYGWPFRAGRGAAQSGRPPADPVDPIAESGQATWAPADLVVHRPRRGRTTLIVATLAAQRLLRFSLRDPRTVGRVATAATTLGRLRALALGPDGCLYFATSNRDGRGSPRPGDDKILRVCQR